MNPIQIKSQIITFSDYKNNSSPIVDVTLELLKSSLDQKEQLTFEEIIQLFDPELYNDLKQQGSISHFIEDIVLSIWPSLIFNENGTLPDKNLFIQTMVRNILIEKEPEEIECLFQQLKIPPAIRLLVQPVINEVLEFASNASKYGYKGAYLLRLQEHASKIKTSTAICINIPSFEPISDEEIRRSLFPNQEIDKLWEQYLQFLSNKQNKEANKELLNIQKLIKEKILALPEDSALLQKIINWMDLQLMEDEHSTFTFRSSSREDRKKNANAGGNTTAPYVEKSIASIKTALVDVVCSYFSEKSFEQRISCHDDMKRKPLMAVIFQKRVGEPLGGSDDEKKCVTSGVANSKKGVKAVIHAHPGFGEKVVAGNGRLDRFYITLSNKVFAHIQSKPSRLVPIRTRDGIQLIEKEPSSERAAKNPSLSYGIAQDIAEAVSYFQRQIGNERDIEFIYDPAKNIIYLVQDRPLPEKSLENPTYVSDKVSEVSSGSRQAEKTVIYADEKVRLLTQPRHWIVGSHLMDALEKYLKILEKNEIRAIFVEEDGSDLSHPAVIFKAANIPVIYLKNADDFLQSHTGSILVDPAQSTIYFLNKEVSLEELEKQKIVVSGRNSYPCSDKLSLFLNDCLEEVDIRTTDFFPQHDVKALIKVISQSASVEEVKKAVYTLCYRFLLEKQYIYQLSERQKIAEIRNLLTEEVDSYLVLIQQLFALQKDLLDGAKYPPNDLRRLAPIHFLKQLLFQAPNEHDVAVFSFEALRTIIEQKQQFYNFLEEAIQKKQISKRLIKDADCLQIAYEGYLSIYNEGIRLSFCQFVDQLRQSALIEQIESFISLMKEVKKFGLLNIFLNIAFVSAWKGKALDCLAMLTKEWALSSDTIRKLKDLKKHIDEFEPTHYSTLERFSQICASETSWDTPEFVDKVIYPLKSPRLKQIFKDSRLLGKHYILSFMHEFVVKYDTAIKAFKGNSRNSSKDIISYKILALRHLLQIFEALSYQAGYLSEDKIREIYAKDQSFFIRQSFDYCGKSLLPPEKLLEPSLAEEFNLTEVVIGNNRFPHGQAQTYEDLFMWLHQNLETLISIIISENFSSHLTFPDNLEKCIKWFEKLPFPTNRSGYSEDHPKLSFVSFGETEIQIRYNMMIGQHSAKFHFHYPLQGENVELYISYFGADEGMRWTMMDAILRLFRIEYKHHLSSDPVFIYATNGGVNYKITIPKTCSDYSAISKLLTIAHEPSLSYYNEYFPLAALPKIIDQKGVYQNKNTIIQTILQQDPMKAPTLYVFLSGILQDMKEEERTPIIDKLNAIVKQFRSTPKYSPFQHAADQIKQCMKKTLENS